MKVAVFSDGNDALYITETGEVHIRKKGISKLQSTGFKVDENSIASKAEIKLKKDTLQQPLFPDTTENGYGNGTPTGAGFGGAILTLGGLGLVVFAAAAIIRRRGKRGK